MKKFVIGLCLTLCCSIFLLSPSQIQAREEKDVASTICNPATTELRMDLRRLWIDHVLWTRNFLISDVANLENKEPVLERLLRNQDDIGHAIKPFYGEEAGDALAKLLREHIVIAGQVIDAAKKNDKAALEISNRLWYENADQMAKFLSEANPYWNYEEMKDLLYTHLQLLTDQTVAHINKDWAADIEAHDKGEGHILELADALSRGIINQFPEKFQ